METHLIFTPRACWFLALTVFIITIVSLLILTDLNIGFVYAISYGVFLLTLFGTAAYAVATVSYTRPPSLRPPRQHGRHSL